MAQVPLVKRTEETGWRARQDRHPTSGKVIAVDHVNWTAIVDVGATNVNGSPAYWHDLAFSPQQPPQLGDHVIIDYSIPGDPHSAHISGMQVGASQVSIVNNKQVIEGVQHPLLDGLNDVDTVAATPSKGALIVGDALTPPKWELLAASLINGYVLTSDNTRPLGVKWAPGTPPWLQIILALTGPYTLAIPSAPSAYFFSNAAPQTVTLPTSVGSHFPLFVFKTDDNANLITLAAAFGDTIDAAANWTQLNTQYAFVVLMPDGVHGWYVIANGISGQPFNLPPGLIHQALRRDAITGIPTFEYLPYQVDVLPTADATNRGQLYFLKGTSGSGSTYDTIVSTDPQTLHYYPLNETSGLVAHDSVGSLNGTISATGVTLNQAGTVDGQPSMFCDGTTSEIDLGGLIVPTGLTGWMVDLWFNASSLGGTIVKIGDDYEFYITSDGFLRTTRPSGPGPLDIGAITVGAWHYLALCYDGASSVSVTLDAFSGSSGGAGPVSGTSTLFGNGGHGRFRGYIQKVGSYTPCTSSHAGDAASGSGTADNLYQCKLLSDGTYAMVLLCDEFNDCGGSGMGGSDPSGPAGGDLSGTYPDPTVVGLQTVPVSSTAPMDGQCLVYSASAGKWLPADHPGLVYAPLSNGNPDDPQLIFDALGQVILVPVTL